MTERCIVITQGEYATARGSEVVIFTLLGSCVSCCLWDPAERVGGMNHILLAGNAISDARSHMAGVHAMELLINSLLKLGARRDRLKAKVFGGAQMVSGLSGIGHANAQFVVNFLAGEAIDLVSQSLGGEAARHLLFWPATGAARLKMRRNGELVEPQAPAGGPLPGNGLELF